MIGLKIDVPLLRNQRDYLLNFPWKDGTPPEEVDGIINLLDYILDIEEGYAKVLDAD